MRRRRTLLAFPAMLAASALLWSSFGQFSSAGGQEEPIEIHRAHEGAHRPVPGRPVFILAIGSDAREKRGEDISKARADSLHIIALDPRSRKASIVGIPRDSYVPIPGRGRNKINAALFFGGPKLMVRAIEQLSGCSFDYYMLIGFEGFKKLVKDFGGVPVDVPTRMVDDSAHIDLQPGEQTLSAPDALGFARSRKTAATPQGDFNRSEHQGLLLLGALRKAREELRDQPGLILKYLALVMRTVETDIPLSEALELGLLASTIDAGDVKNTVTPGETRTIAGAGSIVDLSSRATTLMRDACDDGVIQQRVP